MKDKTEDEAASQKQDFDIKIGKYESSRSCILSFILLLCPRSFAIGIRSVLSPFVIKFHLAEPEGRKTPFQAHFDGSQVCQRMKFH